MDRRSILRLAASACLACVPFALAAALPMTDAERNFAEFGPDARIAFKERFAKFLGGLPGSDPKMILADIGGGKWTFVAVVFPDGSILYVKDPGDERAYCLEAPRALESSGQERGSPAFQS